MVRTYGLNGANAKPLTPGAAEPFAMEVPTVAASRATRVTLGLRSGALGVAAGSLVATLTTEPKIPT